MPECDEEHPFCPRGYEEWLEKVTAEPWFLALEGMVQWTGTWVGTEERLFEELEMRAGKGVFASPDFPSDFERLTLYAQIARDGFAMKLMEFWHHRQLTEENLDYYDAPGWPPRPRSSSSGTGPSTGQITRLGESFRSEELRI